MNEFGNQFFLARTASISPRRATTRFPINANLLLAWLALNAGGLWAADQGEARTNGIAIVENGKARAVITTAPEASLIIQHAARVLQQEIQRRTGALLPISSANETNVSETVIHLGTRDADSALVSTLRALDRGPVSEKSPGVEGFLLASGSGRMVVNGCDDLGVFHGVGWLLRSMEFNEGGASVPRGLEIKTAPMMEMRRIRFGDHFGYVNCDLDGWQDIWGDYILWGLSGATFRCDPAHQGDPEKSHLAGYLWDRWSKMVAQALSMGLEVVPLSQVNLVWKDGRWGPENIPNFGELHYLCPDKDPVSVNPKFPRTMELLLASRKWYFEHMVWGERINYHLFSGWDSGGCNDPDVQPWSVTYARLADQFFPFIKSVNPRARGILGMHAVPEVNKLAEKLQSGWDPDWLYGIEFRDSQLKAARLFPTKYKRFFFPTFTTTDKGQYQAIGANPQPRMCERRFKECLANGVRDGFGCYSEGVHDFINQILFLQLAWDTNRSADQVLAEMCGYYFGKKAAPLVQEAILLMEDETMEHGSLKTNPKIQTLVASAEALMPAWAKSSRQWAMIKGRAGIARTWQRQTDLAAEFERHFDRYSSLIIAAGTNSLRPTKTDFPGWFDETRSYFKSVVGNAREMIGVYFEMNRNGFGVQGGSQQEPEWPGSFWSDAREALAAMEHWKRTGRLETFPQPCIAYVDDEARICLFDWGGRIARKLSGAITRYQRTGETAADAQLVIADVKGDGLERIVYLGEDENFHAWCPLRKRELLAKGPFLTGPLAAGDFEGDGRKEIVALVKTESGKPHLAVVTGDGKVRVLDVSPVGLAPEETLPHLWKANPPVLKRTVNLDYEPRIVMADMNGDGKDEIVCADKDNNSRLVVLDHNGTRIALGPESPSGALCGGDLNGDGQAEVIFADRLGRCAVYSLKRLILRFEEEVKPMFASTIAIAKLDAGGPSTVVYADNQGWIRAIGITGPSRRLSSLSSSVAVGPGMVVGDFDGDGRQDIGYLRRRLDFHLPLSSVAFVNQEGVVCLGRGGRSKPAPLGPRASGRLRFH